MESMSSTFKASLPLNVEEDAELTDRFKDSALAITALFKHAQKSRRSAFVQGYNASITDLRDYIRSNARPSLDQERPLTVGMILDYLEARQAQLLRDLDVSTGPNPSTTAPNRTPTPSTTNPTPTSATASETAATASSRSNTPSYKSRKGPLTSSSSTAIAPVRSRSGSNSGSGSESRSSRPRTPQRTPRPGDVERRPSTTTAVTSSPTTPRRVPPRSSPSLSPAPIPAHEHQSWENASIIADENSKGTGWPEISVLSILPFPPQAYSPTSTYSPTVLPSAGSKRKRDALVDVPMDARNGAVATAAIVGGGGVHLSEHNPFYIAHGGPQKRQSKKRRGTKGRKDGSNGEQGVNNNSVNGEDWSMDMDDDSPTNGNGGSRKRTRNS